MKFTSINVFKYHSILHFLRNQNPWVHSILTYFICFQNSHIYTFTSWQYLCGGIQTAGLAGKPLAVSELQQKPQAMHNTIYYCLAASGNKHKKGQKNGKGKGSHAGGGWRLKKKWQKVK